MSLASYIVGVVLMVTGVGLIGKRRFGFVLFIVWSAVTTCGVFVVPPSEQEVYILIAGWWVIPAIFYYPKRWKEFSHGSSAPVEPTQAAVPPSENTKQDESAPTTETSREILSKEEEEDDDNPRLEENEDIDDDDGDDEDEFPEPFNNIDGKESENFGVKLPPWVVATGFVSLEEREQSGTPFLSGNAQTNDAGDEQCALRFNRAHNPEGEVRAWAIRNQNGYKSFAAYRTPIGDVVVLYAHMGSDSILRS